MSAMRNIMSVGVATVLGGCNFVDLNAIAGSGVAATEERQISDFHQIEVNCPMRVTVKVGGPQSVKVSGDDNVVKRVETLVSNGRLTIRLRGSYQLARPLESVITIPALDDVSGTGACTINADLGTTPSNLAFDLSGASRGEFTGVFKGLNGRTTGASQAGVTGIAAHEATVEATGASKLRLTGTTQSLKIVASGASRVVADGLKAHVTDANLSGASRANVSASDELTGVASGASDLENSVKAAKFDVQTSGASSAKQN